MSNTAMDDAIIDRNVKVALCMYAAGVTTEQASRALDENGGNVNHAMSQLTGREEGVTQHRMTDGRDTSKPFHLHRHDVPQVRHDDTQIANHGNTNKQNAGEASSTSKNDKEKLSAITTDTNSSSQLRTIAEDMKAAAEFVVSLDETTAQHSCKTAGNKKTDGTSRETHNDLLAAQKADEHSAISDISTPPITPPTMINDSLNNLLPPSTTSSPVVDRQVERVYPGAVAVPGPDARSSSNDEFTTTAPASQAVSVVPVTEARIVQGNEEDVQVLQEQLRKREKQLRKREKQLRRMLAEREHAAVAQVLSSDEEAQDGNNEDGSSLQGADAGSGNEFASWLKRFMANLCGPGRKWSVVVSTILGTTIIVSGLLVLVGVVVSLSSNSTSQSNSSGEDDRLPAVAIVGIAFVGAAGAALLAGGGYWLYKRNRGGGSLLSTDAVV